MVSKQTLDGIEVVALGFVQATDTIGARRHILGFEEEDSEQDVDPRKADKDQKVVELEIERVVVANVDGTESDIWVSRTLPLRKG